MKYLATVNGTTFEVDINEDSHVTVDGERYEIDFRAIGNGPLYSLLIGGNSYEGHIEGSDDGWQVLHKGDLYMVAIEDERSQRLMSLGGAGVATKGDYYLKAPMPGLVVSVPVKEGQEIREPGSFTSKIGEEQIFYCNQRGISVEDANALIINGFCREVFKQLPMEFAVEATRLLEANLEGAVG